jgi:multidrug efflux system membrane fusion protein
MTTVPADTLATTPAPRSRGWLWIVGLLLLVGAGSLIWYYNVGERQQQRGPGGFGPGRGRFGGPESTPVRVAVVEKRNIDVQLKALGTVTPLNTVTVRPRLDGELVKVFFTEGQRVSKDQVLAEIDARPYESALNQMLGQQQENEARLKNAQADLETYQRLYKEQLITRQQVTSQEALVAQLQGTIQSNAAQVSNARLNLSYTKVRAPIEGRLGLRQVDAGNLVSSNDANGLVVITQTRPISVIFTVPETDLPAVRKAMRGVGRLTVEAWDRAETEKLADGTLSTVDNQIDTATGTIKLRAEFANGDDSLFPNQFVNIRLKVSTLNDAVTIPAAAVQRASFGTFVYGVKPDNTVTIRRITLGPTEAERVAVTAGLEPGEKIVLEGVDALTEGGKVEVIADGAAPRRPARAAGGPGGPGGRGPGGRGPGGGGAGGGRPGGGGGGPR